jgi:transposase
VIGPTGAVRVMVATRPVDFRKGAEGLAALVREAMQADPFSGAIYVFAKRLENGAFRWPQVTDGVIRLSAAQFSALIEGLDWRRVHEAKATAAPTQAG